MRTSDLFTQTIYFIILFISECLNYQDKLQDLCSVCVDLRLAANVMHMFCMHSICKTSLHGKVHDIAVSLVLLCIVFQSLLFDIAKFSLLLPGGRQLNYCFHE